MIYKDQRLKMVFFVVFPIVSNNKYIILCYSEKYQHFLKLASPWIGQLHVLTTKVLKQSTQISIDRYINAVKVHIQNVWLAQTIEVHKWIDFHREKEEEMAWFSESCHNEGMYENELWIQNMRIYSI